jgi:hypothetical protein
MRTRSASFQRRVLTRRSAGHEESGWPASDLAASEPPHRPLIEVARPGERGDERRADSGEIDVS